MRNRIFSSTLLLGLAAAARADVPVTIFDGSSLAGWTLVHDAKFSVRNGLLCLDGGNGWLRTDQRYRDFIFVVEWRALGPGYDGGIFFRAPLEGKPWPKGYQVNFRHDEVGKLVGVDGAGGPTPPSAKAQGEWNRFELTVKGKSAALKINGTDAWKTDAVEDRDGFIGFQAEIHKFEFRNLELTELGYLDLAEGFTKGSGKHLSTRGSGTWELQPGGILRNPGESSGWLGTTTGDWADFTVKLDYRVPPDGNTGLFLRCPLEGNPSYEGIEIQLVDDDTKRWALRDNQRSGAIFGVIAPSQRATRTAGTWESAEVTAKGSRITVHLNGFQVLDVDVDKDDRKVGEARALKDRPKRGNLGIQSQGNNLEVRGLRVKKL